MEYTLRTNKIVITVVFALLVLFILLFIYLNRALPQEIQPAQFNCLKQEQGDFVDDSLQPKNIYGVGLTYAKHINETASDFNLAVGPPVFIKSSSSYVKGNTLLAMPPHSKLLKSLNELEPGVDIVLNNKDIKLLALLDYEAELAFVLLEDVTDKDLDNANFIPKIGFLTANDMSARSLAVLGEGQNNRFAYWGASKSFPRFTPVSESIWVPHTHLPDAIPCVVLKTYVDGNLRQSENTNNLIYTPADMLRFIHKSYPSTSLSKGDMILTGTPGGVTFNVPRWKARLANIVGLDRFQKLAISQNNSNAEKYLKVGDKIRVSAEWLGSVDITITE
jgi:2-keto-4-pentenoate hydratase/2-oxohepta-3-ene-1,7-dioic acid hydratase in catechol pathway